MKSPILYHPITLPNAEISGNVFLAPMAGFTDAAFRSICTTFGAALTFTEMVSCEGLIRNNEKTTELLRRGPQEPFMAVQLFGADPESATTAAEAVCIYKPALIDLNCGCPVPKVTKTGAGSALMRDPSRIGELVSALRAGCRRAGIRIPITVKLRTGWNSEEITYLEAAESAERNGADMITLHARTRAQGYSGKADWAALETLKQAVGVPVIGSGDLFEPEDACRMIRETGVDGVMFARGAVGNPFIFRRTIMRLRGEADPGPPLLDLRIATARQHLKLAIAQKGERRACREMRGALASYVKGIHGAAAFRRQIVTAHTFDEYNCIFELLLRSAAPDGSASFGP